MHPAESQHQPQVSARVRVVSRGSVVMGDVRQEAIKIDEMLLSKLR